MSGTVYTVTAPVEGFEGTVAGVVFVDGSATVPASNVAAVAYFADAGYTFDVWLEADELAPEPAEPESEADDEREDIDADELAELVIAAAEVVDELTEAATVDEAPPGPEAPTEPADPPSEPTAADPAAPAPRKRGRPRKAAATEE